MTGNDKNMNIAEMNLTPAVITSVEATLRKELPERMSGDLNRVIVFGSCAPGDYGSDSDIDVALIMNCSREDSRRYQDALADLSADIAINNYAIVNFCCIPRKEFNENKKWYLFFNNMITVSKVRHHACLHAGGGRTY